ncbi:MAG: sigma-70 family RNA polymerase sigma factor [Candidatus Poribacteria bacterium]|nr:sigma-70 family RNA polymerase sigma factor [Candidatus Poribacteria bacterium]
MKNNDVDLIHRILDGDDTAFSTLVRNYQKQVHALAWRKIGDFHIAEEITQDTFLKAYQKLATLKKPHRFAGWLYVIATRCCHDWLRKKQIQTESLDDFDKEVFEPEAYSRYVTAQKTKTTVETQRQVVKKLLATLPESERTVITLYYFGEMTCEKMSEFLGVSANTIKSRLRRARNRMKQEEPMIREAITNYKISPNLTDNILQEIAKLKPAAPSVSKPLIPWMIGTASTVLVMLMLGIGSQYLPLFQQSYSLDAQSETTVELVDAQIVQNVAAMPDVRNQLGGRSDKDGKDDGNGNEANQVLGNDGDYTRWNLPIGAKTRLGKGTINGISFSPDGTQIAVGSATGVWIYDTNTGAELSHFTDHKSRSGKVAFSPDGKTLASGMYDKILLWDITTGKLMKTFNREKSSFKTLTFIDDGKTLLCESYKGSVNLWDIKTGIKKDFHPISSKGFSALLSSLFGRGVSAADLYIDNSDGKSIFAVGYEDGKIGLEDVSNGKRLKTLRGHKDSISQLVFSPDGTLLVSAAYFKDPINLWDVTTGKLLKTLTKNPRFWGFVKFSNNGKTLACQTRDNDIELWDVATKTLRTTIGEKFESPIPHGSKIHALAFSSDSKRIAGANYKGEIQIWDVDTGNELSSFHKGHTYGLRELTFSHNSSNLAVGQENTIQLWDTQNFTQLPKLINTDGYSTFVFPPDGNTIISTKGFTYTKQWRDARIKESVTGTLSVWDIHSGEKLSEFPVESHTAEKPYPAGKNRTGMSSGGVNGTVIFSQDGNILAASQNSNDPTKDNRSTILLWEVWEDTRSQKHIILKGHRKRINALAFTPNGHRIASGSDDGTIRLWDASTGTQMLSLTAKNTNTLAFSMDGKILASVNSSPKIQLWDISTGKQLTSLKSQGDNITTLTFSPDNKTLASGSLNGAIELWDISTGRQLESLRGHSYRISELVFSSDGKTLASGGSDGDIFIWNVPN